MKNFFKLFFIGVLLFALLEMCSSCQRGKSHESDGIADVAAIMDSAARITPVYAKGFTVKYQENGVRLVDIADPQKRAKGKRRQSKTAAGTIRSNYMEDTYHFALIPRGVKTKVPANYIQVEVPIRRTIVMTAIQLSNFTVLDAHDVIKGVTGTKNLFNKDIRARVKRGDIVKIGMEGNCDPELILAAHPEVIFISPFKRGGYDTIKETGITLVPHLGSKELDPLGQAEWIKLVGMFVGKEKEANEKFKGIAERYNSLKARVKTTADRPTIFSGEIHGGNWSVIGGRNFLAQIFRDAGADYVLHDDNTGTGQMEFEAMYAAAAHADYWRILNSYPGNFSYEALESAEPRYALFDAFKQKKVIYCNMKQTPYYESSPVMPDVLLSDLVFIFHPGLMPNDYRPTFYHLLK